MTNIQTTDTAVPSLTYTGQGMGEELYILDNNILTKYGTPSIPAELLSSSIMGINGNNFSVIWTSVLDTEYQIQMSSDLEEWRNIGHPITGTGSSITWSDSLSRSNSFYRVIIK